MKKYKVNDLVYLTPEMTEWYSNHSDELWTVNGKVQITDYIQLLWYGLDRFSHENNLPIFGLIEGDNGHSAETFAYKIYAFNELGEASFYIEPKDIAGKL